MSDDSIIKTQLFSSLTVNEEHILTVDQMGSRYPHNFVGVVFKDVNGDPVTPSAGTVTLWGKPLNSNYWHYMDDTPFNANTGGFPNFDGNISYIKISTADIVGAATVDIRLIGNAG